MSDGYRNRIKLLAGTGLAAALLMAGACSEQVQLGGTAEVVDAATVVANVDDEPIYVSDVMLEAESQGIIEPGETLEYDSAEFNKVLDQLIDVKLLSQEAVARGLDEDPQARHRLESAREHILGNILIDAVVAQKIDEAAIRKMYDEQIKIWELGEEAHVRQIVTTTKEEIDQIVASLQKGADFAVLASQKSIDEETRLEGGDIGYVTDDDVTPEFGRAIRLTATGGVSKPFETSAGWVILKVEDRRKELPPSLEELRGPILEYLSTMQIDETLKELRSEARIDRKTRPRNAPLEDDDFPAAPRVEASARKTEAPDSRTAAESPDEASAETQPAPAAPVETGQ